MVKGTLNFRLTKQEDLPALQAILNEVITSSSYNLNKSERSFEDIQDWFEQHQNSNYYVSLSAILDGKFVGWVSLSPFRSAGGYDITAELSVYVHPDYQRQGIAKQMMLEIENYAQKKAKLHNIISVITANNVASIALHDKMGYSICGTLKDVAQKKERLYNVIFMMKRII